MKIKKKQQLLCQIVVREKFSSDDELYFIFLSTCQLEEEEKKEKEKRESIEESLQFLICTYGNGIFSPLFLYNTPIYSSFFCYAISDEPFSYLPLSDDTYIFS